MGFAKVLAFLSCSLLLLIARTLLWVVLVRTVALSGGRCVGYVGLLSKVKYLLSGERRASYLYAEEAQRWWRYPRTMK